MLKQTNNGLTKVWKPVLTHCPFYSGGKIDFIEGGDKVACLHDDNVKILSWDSGTVEDTLLKGDDESRELVSCFCIHPSKNEVVIATQNHLLRHYSLDEKECLRSIRTPHMPVQAMDFDPTGTLVATGSSDRSVRVWDISQGFATHSFKDHTDIIHLVKFHHDPHQLKLFSTSDDFTIRIYDLYEKSCIACFRDHMSIPTSICISADGYILASAGRDKVINFYELRHNVHIKTIPIMEELEGVILLNKEHSESILKAENLYEYDMKSKNAMELTYVVVTAGENGVLHIYKISMMGKDINSFKYSLIKRIRISTNEIIPLDMTTIHSDGNTLHSITSMHYITNRNEIVLVTADHNINTLTIGTGDENEQSLDVTRRIIGSNDDILDIVVLPNSTSTSSEIREKSSCYRIAMITNSTQVRLMDDKMHFQPLEGHTDIVLSVDVSPDGIWLVTSSKDRTIRVWHIPSGSCGAIGEGHGDAVGAVSISQCEGSYTSKQVIVASGAGDKTIKRWSINTLDILHNIESHIGTKSSTSSSMMIPMKLVSTESIRAHDKDVNTIAISPNDTLIASGSQDKSIRIWQSSNLSPLATLNGHKRGIWKIVFSPIDRCLASCSGDHTIKIWSLQDYVCLRTLQGHTSSVLSLQYINRGQQLLSSSSDGLIRLWTIRNGECENVFDSHEGKVWALAVIDEKTFISGGSDSKVIIWDDYTKEEEELRLEGIENNLLVEQQMQNDIRNKRYGKALSAAMELKHSNRVLNIFKAILENESSSTQSTTTSICINDIHLFDTYVQKFTDEDISQIFEYLKDWNTNAKFTYICQILIGSILRVIKIQRLLLIPMAIDSIEGLLSYCDRHYQRIDRLHQATYILEYLETLMTGLPILDHTRNNMKKDDNELIMNTRKRKVINL
eukprot:gene3782-7509_t